MKDIPEIILYGAAGCHKTHYYQLLLNESQLRYKFLDVEANKGHAEELRGLYEKLWPLLSDWNAELRSFTKEQT